MNKKGQFSVYQINFAGSYGVYRFFVDKVVVG